MAGGMGSGRRHDRETLAERVANTRAAQAAAAEHDETPAARTARRTPSKPPPLFKHAWYDGPYGRQPALLWEWRKIGGH